MKTMYSAKLRRSLWCLSGFAITACSAQDVGWTRNFRLGMSIGMNLEADFKTEGQFNLTGSQPGLPGVGGVDHFYDDGYVRVDQTDNAQGRTTFWGYDSASQYDAGAQTLTFNSGRSFTTSGSASADESPYLGLDLAYGGLLGKWLGAQVGWELGFNFLPLNISDGGTLPAQVTRTRHQYSTGGIVMPEPGYQGGANGVGPSIPDVATALPDEVVQGTITGSRTLEASLYNIRLGPTLHWELDRRWAVAASAGFATAMLSGDYLFNETIMLADGTSAISEGTIGGNDFAFGGYAGAVLMYHTNEPADIYIGVHFMSLTDAGISGGGREAELKLGTSLLLSAGINWPF